MFNKIQTAFFSLLIKILLTQEEKLIFSHIHFRHGARSPINLDENNKDIFGNQWSFPGELTSIGKRMEFTLGVYLQDKYSTFIQGSYDLRDIYTISSDLNRTLQSAYSVLSGLYRDGSTKSLSSNQIKKAVPPINLSEEVKKDLEDLWMAPLPHKMSVLPVHVFNVKERRFLLQDNENCPSIRAMKNEYLEIEEFKNYSMYFSKKYSKKINDAIKYDITKEGKMGVFCDQYIANYVQGNDLSIIDEKSEVLYNECVEYMNKSLLFGNYGEPNKTLEIALVSASPTTREMIDYMERRIKLIQAQKSINVQLNHSDYEYPKMVLLSGHDSTLSATELLMMKAFPNLIHKYVNPVFASNIIFELYINDTNGSLANSSNYYIKYIVNGEDIISNLQFSEFKKNIEMLLYSDEEIISFCELSYWKYLLAIMIAFILFIIILVILLICTYFKVKRENSKKEDPKSKDDPGPLLKKEEEKN